MSDKSALLIRLTVVALFAWFGTQQLIDPTTWVTYLPDWTGYFPVPGEILVQLNGLFEAVTAALLALGVFTRVVAAVLGIKLLMIAVTAGGAVGVRDAALGMMTLALTLSAPDRWTVDVRGKKV